MNEEEIKEALQQIIKQSTNNNELFKEVNLDYVISNLTYAMYHNLEDKNSLYKKRFSVINGTSDVQSISSQEDYYKYMKQRMDKDVQNKNQNIAAIKRFASFENKKEKIDIYITLPELEGKVVQYVPYKLMNVKGEAYLARVNEPIEANEKQMDDYKAIISENNKNKMKACYIYLHDTATNKANRIGAESAKNNHRPQRILIENTLSDMLGDRSKAINTELIMRDMVCTYDSRIKSVSKLAGMGVPEINVTDNNMGRMMMSMNRMTTTASTYVFLPGEGTVYDLVPYKVTAVDGKPTLKPVIGPENTTADAVDKYNALRAEAYARTERANEIYKVVLQEDLDKTKPKNENRKSINLKIDSLTEVERRAALKQRFTNFISGGVKGPMTEEMKASIDKPINTLTLDIMALTLSKPEQMRLAMNSMPTFVKEFSNALEYAKKMESWKIAGRADISLENKLNLVQGNSIEVEPESVNEIYENAARVRIAGGVAERYLDMTMEQKRGVFAERIRETFIKSGNNTRLIDSPKGQAAIDIMTEKFGKTMAMEAVLGNKARIDIELTHAIIDYENMVKAGIANNTSMSMYDKLAAINSESLIYQNKPLQERTTAHEQLNESRKSEPGSPEKAKLLIDTYTGKTSQERREYIEQRLIQGLVDSNQGYTLETARQQMQLPHNSISIDIMNQNLDNAEAFSRTMNSQEALIREYQVGIDVAVATLAQANVNMNSTINPENKLQWSQEFENILIADMMEGENKLSNTQARAYMNSPESIIALDRLVECMNESTYQRAATEPGFLKTQFDVSRSLVESDVNINKNLSEVSKAIVEEARQNEALIDRAVQNSKVVMPSVEERRQLIEKALIDITVYVGDGYDTNSAKTLYQSFINKTVIDNMAQEVNTPEMLKEVINDHKALKYQFDESMQHVREAILTSPEYTLNIEPQEYLDARQGIEHRIMDIMVKESNISLKDARTILTQPANRMAIDNLTIVLSSPQIDDSYLIKDKDLLIKFREFVEVEKKNKAVKNNDRIELDRAKAENDKKQQEKQKESKKMQQRAK